MIDAELKQKLLDEIAKIGNVYSSCRKTGVNKSTYYRWKKEDPEFRKEANEMERMGRSNIVDMAEGALTQLVTEKNLGAIKYVLSHNSPRYKGSRQNKTVIEHINHSDDSKSKEPNTLFEYLDMMRKKREQKAKEQISETNLPAS